MGSSSAIRRARRRSRPRTASTSQRRRCRPSRRRPRSPRRARPSMIHLAYAKALTRGRPDVRVAVLDTGVDLRRTQSSAARSYSSVDFVDLEGLDTSGVHRRLRGRRRRCGRRGRARHARVRASSARAACGWTRASAPGCGLVAVRVLATMRRDGRLYGAGIVDNINRGIKYAVDACEGRRDQHEPRHQARGGRAAACGRHPLRAEPQRDRRRGQRQRRDAPSATTRARCPGVCAVGAVTDDRCASRRFTSYGAHDHLRRARDEHLLELRRPHLRGRLRHVAGIAVRGGVRRR